MNSKQQKLTIDDIDDIARGAAFLGAGGGGDPYIGRLMAQNAVAEYGMPEIIEPEDLDDDAIVLTVAMLGAPTVLLEKAACGDDVDAALKKLEEHLGKKADAIIPIEIGGVNSTIPIMAAARNKLPLVNGDGMGRAFPEIQMVTFSVYGIPITPFSIVDEHLNSVIVVTKDPKKAEDRVRQLAVQMGLSVIISGYPLTGRQVKDYAVKGTLTLAHGIGKSIREGRKTGDPVENMLSYLRTTDAYNKCKVLYDGKVTDIRRETRGGFSVGFCKVEPLSGTGEAAILEFQNEHLVARINGKTVTIVPDIICVVDRETGEPITAETLRYGQRVKVVGTSVHPIMRTPESLNVFGPHAFGINEDYQPIETIHNL